MVLAGSDCLHVISDCFDSFFRDLHVCRKWFPPENCKVEQNMMENLQVLEKNFDGPNSMRWRGRERERWRGSECDQMSIEMFGNKKGRMNVLPSFFMRTHSLIIRLFCKRDLPTHSSLFATHSFYRRIQSDTKHSKVVF